MPGEEAGSRAAQTPRCVVPAQAAVCLGAFPLDAMVGHAHLHEATPLHLPEAAGGDGGSAQQLQAVVEAVGVVSRGLVVVHQLSLGVIVGQLDLAVGRVWVQFKLAGDWVCWERGRWCSYNASLSFVTSNKLQTCLNTNVKSEKRMSGSHLRRLDPTTSLSAPQCCTLQAEVITALAGQRKGFRLIMSLSGPDILSKLHNITHRVVMMRRTM